MNKTIALSAVAGAAVATLIRYFMRRGKDKDIRYLASVLENQQQKLEFLKTTTELYGKRCDFYETVLTERKAPRTGSPMYVAVGSTNPVKIGACQKAFEACFPTRRIVARAFKVKSGVPDQPMGDKETRTGAINRAREALQGARALAGRARESKAADSQEPDFAVGLEGGLEDSEGDLICMAWMCVLDARTGKTSTSKTASFALPEAVTKLVRGGLELAKADDVFFKRENSGQSDGTVCFASQSSAHMAMQAARVIVLLTIFSFILMYWRRPRGCEIIRPCATGAPRPLASTDMARACAPASLKYRLGFSLKVLLIAVNTCGMQSC